MRSTLELVRLPDDLKQPCDAGPPNFGKVDGDCFPCCCLTLSGALRMTLVGSDAAEASANRERAITATAKNAEVFIVAE